MKKYILLIILTFSFYTVRLGAQCTADISGGIIPVCYNTSPGILTVNVTGDPGPFTYSWNINGAPTGIVTQTYDPGNLTTTITITCDVSGGTCGNITSNSFIAAVYGNLNSSIGGGTSPICYNTSPGTFTASGSGGTGSYSYLWYKDGISTGVTTQTYNPGNLTATSTFYCAVTSGACGTVNTSTSTITVHPNFTAGMSGGTTPICYNTSPGAFTATGTGGTGSYTYLWHKDGLSTGVSTQTYNPGNLTATSTFYCAITSGSCGTVNTSTSTITVHPNFTAGMSGGTTPICYNTSPGTFSSTGTGGTGSFTYLWYRDGLSTGISTETYNPGNLTATSTFYCAITSGTCGTVNTSTSTITVHPNFTAGISGGTTPICYNTSPGTFTATGTGGTGSYTYLWYKDGLSTGTSTQTYNPGNLTATATFYCAVTSGTCGTDNTPTTTITVHSNLTAAISGGTSPICSNTSPGTLTATGSGGNGLYTYLWYKDDISQGITTQTYNPGNLTATSTFYCAITSDACGTVNTSSITITVTAQPTAVIFYTGSPWCGSAGVQNVTLSGNSGGTFSAQPSGLTIDPTSGAINPATSTPGTYTVFYNIPALGGCGSFNTTTSVAISPTPTAPVIGVIAQPSCSVANGSVVLNSLPASGNWTITRNPGGVTTSGSGTTYTYSNLPAGSYTFFVTNTAFCTSPESSPVEILAQPVSPAIPVQSVDCSLGFGQAKISVTSPVGSGLEYSLDGGTYQTGVTFATVSNGSHYLSVRNTLGCTTTGPVFTVTCGCINPPTVTLSSISGNICSNSSVSVTGNSFGGSATSVTINSNGGGILSPSGANTSPFTFTYTPVAADGGKTVTITVTTNNPIGGLCMPGVATYALIVNTVPTPPSIGTITNLTCTVPTGSVVLGGLPSAGTWTLIRNPGGILTNGTGTTTTISGLIAGTFNFIVTSAEGCTSAASADAVINSPPLAPSSPVVGTITQPTCATSTGSVVLSGLPATGNWTITRTPGGSFSGTGTTTTVSVIPANGTYTFAVTNSAGCTSSQSGNVVINPQPSTPGAPTIGTIVPPSCSVSTGSVSLTGLPASGTWTLIRYPGTISTSGTGTTTTIAGLATGTYNYTVTTVDGCLSALSSNVIIPVQPLTPVAPAIGTITQPTFAVPTGSVVLSGLPATGTWTITRLPGAVTTTGSGTTKTIANLAGGVFTFTVTNSSGCTSAESAPVTISTPGPPELKITNPPEVCSPATVDLTAAAVTEGSTQGLTYTYWIDSSATVAFSTPAAATSGTYYIKGTTVAGFSSIKPVTVVVDQPPIANAGLDQTLYYQYNTTLDASLAINETGNWSLISGTGNLSDVTDPKTKIQGLLLGQNVLLWTVKGPVCPSASDTLNIMVENLIIPTLITPNMDGKNDYFVIRGLNTLGKTELIIFDRRGAQVFKNTNYDNLWNGVDFNEKPLPDDTYFYVLKSENGKSVTGYIIIRR